MKKTLIALAVLASASGAVMAQSSVTMFGVVDVGVGYVKGDQSVSGVTQSGNSSSRLGFRGVEDLGGGLKAGFWLEGAVSPDVGTGVGGGASGPGFEFKRRSTISLMGNFGEVRMGRELTAGYSKPSSYDPFGQVGIGHFNAWSVSRIGNGISYNTPQMGGLFATVHYGFGEQVGSTSAGSYIGLAGGYDNGPLSVTLAADQLKNVTPTADALKTWSLGASYDLGMIKPAFIYHAEKVGSFKQNNFMIALTAPVGPGKLIGSYARYDLKNSSADSDGLSVGYVYDLSKRTAVYGTYAYIKNKDGANRNVGAATGSFSGLSTANQAAFVNGENVNGFQVGVRHNF